VLKDSVCDLILEVVIIGPSPKLDGHYDHWTIMMETSHIKTILLDEHYDHWTISKVGWTL